MQYLLYPFQDVVLREGERCTLKAKVTGTPVPKVTWFKDGVPVDHSFGYGSGYDLESGLCTLQIEEALAEDSANWSLRASNVAGQLLVPDFQM